MNERLRRRAPAGPCCEAAERWGRGQVPVLAIGRRTAAGLRARPHPKPRRSRRLGIRLWRVAANSPGGSAPGIVRRRSVLQMERNGRASELDPCAVSRPASPPRTARSAVATAPRSVAVACSGSATGEPSPRLPGGRMASRPHAAARRACIERSPTMPFGPRRIRWGPRLVRSVLDRRTWRPLCKAPMSRPCTGSRRIGGCEPLRRGSGRRSPPMFSGLP